MRAPFFIQLIISLFLIITLWVACMLFLPTGAAEGQARIGGVRQTQLER